MSLGYCGKCKLIEQDETIARYAYSGENWNDPNSKPGDIDLLDGMICVFKKCLEEPEIHIKHKKLPSGKRKMIEKRIVHTPAISEHILNGDIVIEKRCKNEFKRTDASINDCYLAYMLMNKVFVSYQEDGTLPKEEIFMQ